MALEPNYTDTLLICTGMSLSIGVCIGLIIKIWMDNIQFLKTNVQVVGVKTGTNIQYAVRCGTYLHRYLCINRNHSTWLSKKHKDFRYDCLTTDANEAYSRLDLLVEKDISLDDTFRYFVKK